MSWLTSFGKPFGRSAAPGRNIGAAAAGLVVALYGLTACTVGSTSMAPPAPPATATPQPTATQTPAPTVIFSDPMTSNVNGWHEGNGCAFKSDGYHITNANEICFAPVNTPVDADISVQASQISGSLRAGYGLVMRLTPTNTNLNGYVFLIAGAGAWTFIKSGSTDTVIVPFTATSAIHPGMNAPNTLEVRMQGSHFTFIINGTSVGEADDATFSGSVSGLVGNSEADIAFTNYTITVPHSTAAGYTQFPSSHTLPAHLAALAIY